MDNSKLTREDYVYLAKLYEKAEKADESIEFIKKFIELNPVLTRDDRSTLCSGYKFKYTTLRNSWRILFNMLKKETSKKEKGDVTYIVETMKKVEDEMREVILDIHDLIDTHLLPHAVKNESKVYYLKLKGDYYRYLSEFAQEDELEEALGNADLAYNDAYEIAENNLQISNAVRLGLALNFSIFYYEQRNLKEDACLIAKNAFEEAMKSIGEIEKNKSKEAITIVQILKENLLLWSNELNDDEIEG